MVPSMNAMEHRGLGLLSGLFFTLMGACTSSGLPDACNQLILCCQNHNTGGGASSCQETAMQGMVGECTSQLATYRSNGTCPYDAGADASH